MQGQMGGAAFLIDGKSFAADRVDIRVPAGQVEDWIIRNTSPMDHPFHLHIWPFQLMETSSGGPVSRVEWKDTINVPANSWARLRIPFTGMTGKTVFHCHILDHEDLGMMATIEVS
jgi:FtsP/CotA-like multicopper oxidase with cupredoxin domain